MADEKNETRPEVISDLLEIMSNLESRPINEILDAEFGPGGGRELAEWTRGSLGIVTGGIFLSGIMVGLERARRNRDTKAFEDAKEAV